MESQGDYRGAIVAAREARECLLSANDLLTRANEAGQERIVVTVEYVGTPALVMATEPAFEEQPALDVPGRTVQPEKPSEALSRSNQALETRPAISGTIHLDSVLDFQAAVPR